MANNSLEFLYNIVLITDLNEDCSLLRYWRKQTKKQKQTKIPTQPKPALSNREDVQEKISTELVNQQVDHQSWKPSNFPTIKTQSLMVSVGFSDLGIIRAVASSF